MTPLLQKGKKGDFPGGPAVKNPPSHAGDSCLIPGWGTKTPHALEQLSPHAATKTQHSQINIFKKLKKKNHEEGNDTVITVNLGK